MYENLKNPPKKVLMEQLDALKPKIATIVDFDIDIDTVLKAINRILKSTDNGYIMMMLRWLKKYFVESINEYSLKYLRSVGLFPPPDNYIPNHKKY